MKLLRNVSYSAVIKTSSMAVHSLRSLFDPSMQGNPYYVGEPAKTRSSFKIGMPSFSMKKRLSYTWR